MPDPKPLFKNISNEMMNDRIDFILNDLNCVIEEYGTAFGKSMLYTIVAKIKLLKEKD